MSFLDKYMIIDVIGYDFYTNIYYDYVNTFVQ